jgi:hypothetical protein
MGLRNSKRVGFHYPCGVCLGFAVLFSMCSLTDASAGRRVAIGLQPPYRETFDSGRIDWARDWETGLGDDFCTSFYRVDQLKAGCLFGRRQSRYSNAPHDYFNEEMAQIIKPYKARGFWDPRGGNWVSKLYWTRSKGWYDAAPHDWSNSIELEEGALMAAMISGNAAMNSRLAHELRFIHGSIAADGRVDRLVAPQNGFEYGLVLSALALGSLYFKGADAAVGDMAYADLRRVFRYVAPNYPVPPVPVEMTCMIIRGYANACRAFDARGDAGLRDYARTCLDALSEALVRCQEPGGGFRLHDKEYRIQKQLKAQIALLLAYGVSGNADYLRAAQMNMDWVLMNRWDRSEKRMGGFMWHTGDATSFFEVHQMWFLIAARYLESYLGTSYAPYRDAAVAFLTDDNFAGVDLYEDNDRVYGAFFSYRAISRDGAIQEIPFHQWKGGYEIGASLWAMALYRDTYSEGHSWLATQAPEDSSDGWDKAIFTRRDFGGGAMRFQWDVRFRDTGCPGAYTGLFNDQLGDWRILLDTSTGLAYRSLGGEPRVLFDPGRLVSGRRYTVQVETVGESDWTIALLEDGVEVCRGSVRDGKPFDSCYFGVFQDNAEAMSAKNVYVTNIEYSPTVVRLPQVTRLYRSDPNPFKPGETIEFDLNARGRVRLRIYDKTGTLVATIADRVLAPGRYRFHWDGRDVRGSLVASGVYFCEMETESFSDSKMMAVLR